jgi:hypothetical protein
MLRQLLLDAIGQEADPEARASWARLAAEFPTVSVQSLAAGEGAQVLTLDVSEWRAPGFDPFDWDPRVFAACGTERLALHLTGASGAALAGAALEILTRYQGLIERRNAASSGGLFDLVLARHRELHDLNWPLVRADYLHALDAWQWVLRLEPQADLALQVATLFHDVERLVSGAVARIEPTACALLEELGADRATRERVHHLVTPHARAEGDAALALLNDADALSFFSLNSSGFLRYCSPERTRSKVASSLARLRPQHHQRLGELRLAPAMRMLLDVQLSRSSSA